MIKLWLHRNWYGPDDTLVKISAVAIFILFLVIVRLVYHQIWLGFITDDVCQVSQQEFDADRGIAILQTDHRPKCLHNNGRTY